MTLARPLGVTGLVVGGSLLVGQALVPWASSGTLSTTAPVDVVGLVADGTLTDVGPLEVAVVVALPLLGGLLVAAAAATGGAVRRVRALAALLAAVLAGVLLVRLTDLGAGPVGDARVGLGAFLALGGVVLALVGTLLASLVHRRTVRASGRPAGGARRAAPTARTRRTPLPAVAGTQPQELP